MPRFAMHLDPEPVSLAYEVMPSNPRSRRSSTPAGPCRGLISCLAPDGRTMYSLKVEDDQQVSIYAHNLPLEGYIDEEIEREFPAVIQAKLPDSVCSTLNVDAPVELVCVDGDTMPRPPRITESGPPQQCLLPVLCLYTRHSVFLIKMAFPCPFETKQIVMGIVLSVTEPFESLLVEDYQASIVRVRPAPQRRMGYAAMCPPESMAVLTHDSTINAYALHLYHGPHEGRPEGWVSSPLRFGMEQLVEEEENSITDFGFAQSNGQALLATLSIHLLRASGEVWGASPILFDGAVVPRSIVRDSVDYLEYVIESDTNDARVRQCCAAKQFFLDAFGPEDCLNNYVTARTSVGGGVENALFWPLQVQGPILVAPPIEPDEEMNRALVIEPFFARDLVGVAIGRKQAAIDFAVLPPAALLPRFDYMDERDRDDIDDYLVELGVIVERLSVDVGDNEDDRRGEMVALVRDPVVDSTIHFASNQGIVSIKTNAMSLFSNKIREEAFETGSVGFLSPSRTCKDETIRSTAWSSLDVSAGNLRITLLGAVVSGDAQLGHSLVAFLSDGTACAVNLTESRYLHESDSLFSAEDEAQREKSRSSVVADDALRALEETPPLHELLSPLLQQVQSGLDGMGKIVGSETAPKDINPGTLATVISVKERCEKDIMLPLKEMKQITASRSVALNDMHKSQMTQILSLNEAIQLLKDRSEATSEQLEVAELNATLLSRRSSAILQASQNLRPTLTNAEQEYFQLLKRVKAKCDAWEATIGGIREAATSLSKAMKAGRATLDVSLEPNEIIECHAILRGQEKAMRSAENALRQTQHNLDAVATATGLCSGNKSSSGTGTSGQQ